MKISVEKSIIWLMLLACIIFGGIIFSVLKITPTLSNQVAEKLKTEFISYATEMQKQTRLIVAEIKQVESVERTSELSVFWEQIKLPDLVVAITTPVVFSYYVDLNQDWKFEIQDQVLLVTIPTLNAGLPAPDLSQTKFEVRKGSLFRNEQAALKDLQQQMTGILISRAQSNKHLVIETARAQIGEFVIHWLKEKFVRDQKKIQVKVQFADEKLG